MEAADSHGTAALALPAASAGGQMSCMAKRQKSSMACARETRVMRREVFI